MAGVTDYRDLEAWQKGMRLCVEVYRLSRLLPAEEKFGMISQARRASVSIPSNIAEGHARKSTGEFLQGLSVSRGSLAELKTLLELSVCLEYLQRVDIEEAWRLAGQTGRLINGLMKALETRRRSPTPAITHARRPTRQRR